MNRFTWLFIAIALTLSGCVEEIKEKVVPVTDVTVSPSTLTLLIGESSQLTAKISPADASEQTVSWGSSHEDVVSVDSDGKVTALTLGTATVTATVGNKQGTCIVKVESNVIPVNKITLDKSTLELVEGNSYTLIATVEPADATDKTVTWTSSDEAVATVTDGVVVAVKEGSALITAQAGNNNATCDVVVTLYVPQLVDLGLSVLWADCNVGARQPEEYGNYYAWGEVETKEIYKWVTYYWCEGDEYHFFKYNFDVERGEVDHRTQLMREDDVASVKYGDKWRMPTHHESHELEELCDWKWSTRNGINGYLVTGPNGNSIFLPAGGYMGNTVKYEEGTDAYYWSSSLWLNSYGAFRYPYVTLEYGVIENGSPRPAGIPVRAVFGDCAHVSAIHLCQDLVEFSELGRSSQLEVVFEPYYAAEQGLKWESSRPDVVSVSSSGLITSVGYGSSEIIVTSIDGGFTASCNVNVFETSEASTTKAIDLGLSVKWGSCNVGASYPEDYGEYFAWGESFPKEKYDWDTYQWSDGDYNTLKKYNNDDYWGIADNRTILNLEDDVANNRLGGDWRIPTQDEWRELIDNCICKAGTMNGVKGCFVFGSNGEKIFIPQAGYKHGENYYKGYLEYWSSSVYQDRPYYAWSVAQTMENRHQYNSYGAALFITYPMRHDGYPIRPVYGEFIHVNSISIRTDSQPEVGTIELSEGNSVVLTANISPYNAFEKGVQWTSSDPTVAEVTNTGRVVAMGYGSATITATSVDNGIQASCLIKVKSITNGHRFVDLGLSVRWADRNIGAGSVSDYGNYYAWGETFTKFEYSGSTYTLGHMSGGVLNMDYYINKDNWQTLKLGDDAARAAWGGEWRMPTIQEYRELINHCSWEWVTMNGIKGILLTSNINGNTLFFPAGGFISDSTPYYRGSNIYYWASTKHQNDPYIAHCYHQVNNYLDVYNEDRIKGMLVRAVIQ